MATSNTGVIVKRSFTTAIPPYLEPGELAYSYVSNTFFIGSPTSDGVLNVGGLFYTQTIDAATSNNTPNTLVKRDASGNIPGLNASNLVNGSYTVSLGTNGTLTAAGNITAPGIVTAQNITLIGTSQYDPRLSFVNNKAITAGQDYITVSANTLYDYNGFFVQEGINAQAVTYTEGDILLIANSSGTISPNWKFGKDANTTFPGGATIGDAYRDGGTTLKASATGTQYIVLASNNLQQYVQVDDQTVYIGTNYGINDKNWVFSKDGITTFPGGATVSNNSVITASAFVGVHADVTGNQQVFLQGDGVFVQTFDGVNYHTFQHDIYGNLVFPDNTSQSTAFTGTAIDQVARDAANNASSGSAVDQFARNRANTDVTNVSLVGTSIGSSTQIPVIGYAANGRITSAGVASPQIATGSLKGVTQLNDSISSTLGTSGANAATPLAVKTAYDYAQVAFNKANTSNTLAQAAFDKANNSISADQYARDTANTAAANTVIIQGVDLTQNTRINSVENLIVSSYNQANAAFTQANVGATFVNTGGTVSGNVTFTKNLSVTGNLYVLGNTTTINTSSFTVQDSLIVLGLGNYTTDILDIGFAGHYNNGTNAHAGLIRDASVKEFYLFDGYTPELDANNNIDINNASFNKANLNAGFVKGNLIGSTAVVNGLDLYNYVTSGYAKANSANVLAQSSFDVANISYGKANSANVLAQAAFDKANTAASTGIDQYARDIANTAASNTVYISSVNTSQNTSISSAYDKANSANILAQAAFNQANTDVTNISLAGSTVGSSTQIPVIGYAANGRIISAGVASPQTATGSLKGIIQLNDSTSSTSDVSGANAATPLAVKTTYDYANAAFSAANNRVLKTGDTITGTLNVNSNISSTKPNTGSVIVTGGVGVSDSIYVGNRVGFSNTSNVSIVYQYYNAATNSLDTVFG
jgi:hypothetical protein